MTNLYSFIILYMCRLIFALLQNRNNADKILRSTQVNEANSQHAVSSSNTLYIKIKTTLPAG